MTLTLLVLAWLLTYLVHSTILLGGAWVLAATRLVRAPAARDTLWKVALVGGILTASVYSLFPYQPYAAHLLLPSATVTASAPAPAPVAARGGAAVTAGSGGVVWAPRAPRSGSAPVARRTAGSRLPAPGFPTPNTLPAAPTWPRLLLGLWMLGALALLVRLFVLQLRLRRSLGRRREIGEGPLAAMLDSLRACAGVRRRPRLTASAELSGPVAIGTSEICLPERALTSLDAEQQRAVLAHELGHLVRQDPLWLGVAALCESVFFFQPLNRLARRHLQEAAEYLCDDWAVHQTGGSLTLAKCLAEVATWMDAGARAVPVAGMAENRSQLVERVHRLLEGAKPSRPGLRIAVPVAVLALSSMAFAAPGVSPPCDEAQALAASGRGASSAPAVWQGEPKDWATIRGARVLTFRDGFAARLTGHGHLAIRRGGRAIELADGQRLTVNGRQPDEGEVIVVRSTDSLRIVDTDGRTLWSLAPVRVASTAADAGDWNASAERAESEMDRAADRIDAAGDEIDSADDVLDTLDVAEITRNAAEISRSAAEIGAAVGSGVTSGVLASVLPQVAQLQQLGATLGGVISARVVGEVVPAIVDGLQGLCDGGLCDDSTPPVKHRGKVLKLRP